MAENVFGFGENDDNIGKKSKAWKAEAGYTYRASFCWFPIADGKLDLTAKSPKFVGAQINYIPGVGYIQNEGTEYTKVAGEPAQQKILTLLTIWPTTKQGVVDKARVTTDFDVVPWVFSADKYNQLKALHTEFGFGDHDINIACTDSNFQKMTFAPCKESLLKTLQSKGDSAKPIIDKIVAAVNELGGKSADFLGRKMTIAQIKEKLAGGTGAGPASGSAAGGDAAVAGNIDSMVDGLLD